MSFTHSKSSRRSNEDVFFDYYPQLLEWATQLVGRSREEAEDLVHDLYFRVVRIVRPIVEVEALDAYLFRILRNLYYAKLRRASRDSIHHLSIVDYDSLEQGLASVDRRELLSVRANLEEVCRYACQRKGTSRSASVLILRFFLGYYASEVMKILAAPRYSVDRSLQVARQEARMFLERPGALRFLTQGRPPEPVFSGDGGSQKLFSELKEAIFSATEGGHFAPDLLEQRYTPEHQPPPYTAPELAHLVSCGNCLDRVNATLNLPLLAERTPESGLDRDQRSGPGGGRGSGPSNTRKPDRNGPSLRKLERRTRELYEHRPDSLQIVVDGETRSSQRVNAERNELHLKLHHRDEPSLVEVFSEQGLCLAHLEVGTPGTLNQLEQREETLLSDGRSLTLTVSFAADVPIIHVLYCDPVIADAASTDPYAEDAQAPAAASLRPSPGKAPETQEHPARHRGGWLADWWTAAFTWVAGGRMSAPPAGAALIALSAILGVWMWRCTPRPPSADVLLRQAETASVRPLPPAGRKVITQTILIRTDSGSFERTIHRDPSGRRRPKQRQLDIETAALESRLTRAGVAWDEPLSPAAFGSWRQHSHVTRDSVQRTGGNLLTLTTAVTDPEVREESLTLRASDLHPVTRTVSFRDTGVVEIAELDYSVEPWNPVVENWFEPEGSAAIPDVPATPGAVHDHRVPSDEDLDAAELAARTVLNDLHADEGEPITLSREQNGITVKGVVETTARKRDLLSRLEFLPNVHVSILSTEEVGAQLPRRLESGDGEPVPVLAVESRLSPLERYLRAGNSPVTQLDSITNSILDGAIRIRQADAHLAELRLRFNDTRLLPSNERTQLQALRRQYAGTILTGLEANRKILASLGLETAAGKGRPPGGSGQVLDQVRGQEPAQELDGEIRHYRELCSGLIGGDADQAASAPAIAEDLIRTGERIRRDQASMDAVAPQPPESTEP